MNTSIRRRIAAIAVATLALAGIIATPQQASAHSRKTTVNVSASVNRDGIVKVTWKYSGSAPASQSLRVYGDKGALNYMTYRVDRSSRGFTFSNLTPDMHYRIHVVGTKPSVRGSVELTTPAKSSGAGTNPTPTPSPTTPGATPTPTPSPTPSTPAKPSAPTGLGATTTENSATLSWTAPANTEVTGYRVEMRQIGGTFFTIASTTTTSHKVNALFQGTTYEFRVATVTTSGVSDFTAPITVVPAPAPTASPTPTPSPTAGGPTAPAPVAPTGLGAIAGQSAGTVRLSWLAPATGATPTKYRIEIASATSGWVPAGDTPSNGTSADITALNVGSTYQFRVSTIAGLVVSAPSAAVSYTVPAVNVTVPSAVRSLQATVSGTAAMLTWTAPESTSGLAVTAHKLQVSADASNWINLTDGTAANAANLTGLESGRRYYFRVAAVTSAGVGAWSGPVSVQVP
jgi:predicted phage tail protein